MPTSARSDKAVIVALPRRHVYRLAVIEFLYVARAIGLSATGIIADLERELPGPRTRRTR
jgi:hypothetical protein